MNYKITGVSKEVATKYAGQLIHAHKRINADDNTGGLRTCSGIVIGYSSGMIWLKNVVYKNTIYNGRGFAYMDHRNNITLTIANIKDYELVDGLAAIEYVLKISVSKEELINLIKALEL